MAKFVQGYRRIGVVAERDDYDQRVVATSAVAYVNYTPHFLGIQPSRRHAAFILSYTMAAQNSPLTPPITESDARQMSASQIAPSTAPPDTTQHSSTIYLDIFPTISNLAIQNHLSDLVRLSEDAELSVCAIYMRVCDRLRDLFRPILPTEWMSPDFWLSDHWFFRT